jgi:hypothetical protein
MTVRAWAQLACAVAMCIPLLAHAEGPASPVPLVVALEYQAAPECPNAGEFKAIVTGRLGYNAIDDTAGRRVSVDIASRGRSFEGHIEWRDAGGRWAGDRFLPSRSGDCGELAREIGFALALQIQLMPGGSGSSSATPPAETTGETAGEASGKAEVLSAQAPASLAKTPPSIEQAGSPSDSPDPRLSTKSPTIVAVGVGTSVGFGLSSSPVPFGRVFGSLAWSHTSMELAAEGAWPTTTHRSDGAGFSQQALLASLAGCGSIERWSACLLAKGGAIRVAGKNIDVPASRSGPVFQTGLRLAVTQFLGSRAYLAAQVEGLVNVTHWKVTLDQNLVWTSPRFAGTVGLNFGVRFP